MSTSVPAVETDVLILDRLHIEAYGRNSLYIVAELHLVLHGKKKRSAVLNTEKKPRETHQNRGLSGGIETKHQNANLLLTEEL